MAYVPFVPQVEENSGEYLTDPAGFIPIVERIEDMIAAGENLNEVRESEYDGSDIDMDLDPTRSLTFDEVDAQRMAEMAAKSLEESSERASKAKADKKSGNVKVEKDNDSADSIKEAGVSSEGDDKK